jgi:enoyl-CoA hydratase/carnithine racemase
VEYQTILYETSADGVATITINRPESMNSFNRTMCNEFHDAWKRVREDNQVKAVVLRAAGKRAFCTGVDVKEGLKYPADMSPFDVEDPSVWLGPKQNLVWKPVVCAINGMAAGGAFYWLNESDVIICGESATFFDPHVTFGMVSACEPTGMMHRIPYLEIMRIILMGNDERISAQTALRISLVTEITSDEGLWARAHEIAAGMAAKPAAAIQGTVRCMWEGRDMPPSVALINSFKYTQLGNHIGTAEVNRATAPKAKWKLR